MVVLGLFAAALADPVVAVTPFVSHTLDPELVPLGEGLPALLVTDLVQTGKVRVVERVALNRVLDELALQNTAFVDPATAAKVGRGVGATVILHGTVVSQGEALRIDALAVDVATAEVIGAAKATGSPDEFFVMEKVLATEILDALGIELTATEQFALQQPATTSLPAVLAWSTGLDRVDVGDTDAAIDQMRRAIAADRGFAPARAQLDALRAEIDSANEARDDFTDAAYVEAPAWIEACKNGDCEALADFIVVKVQSHTSDPARRDDLKRLTTLVLDAGLDEQAKHFGGYRINEIALFYRYQLCPDAACQVRWGTELMKRYPDSIQYDGVAARVSIQADLLEDPG